MLHRAVLVTRTSRYQHLLNTHGTHGQARWFLEQRGQDIEPLVAADTRQRRAARLAATAVPDSWRQARLDRSDLDRFLFEPQDVVIVIGQDGLVANVARFLTEQVVMGVNPDPAEVQGVLVQHRPEAVAACLRALSAGAHEVPIAPRAMVEARTDDGQSLRALNEVFVGHEGHQSARYRLLIDGVEERHSSSGLIVATGTGSTGWAASVALQRRRAPRLPGPRDHTLAWFVREAWPSATTGCQLTAGLLPSGTELTLVSEQDEGGVIFGDGIEADRLRLRWGQTIRIGQADHALQLLEAA